MHELPTQQASADTLLEVVRHCVVTVVPEIPPSEITAGRTLAELGCNSVDRAEVMVMAMRELSVTVPVSEFGSAPDISGIIALLRKHG